MKLSIIIPCYNEKQTILKILKRINNVAIPDIEKEIIIIDDASTDGTRDLLKRNNKKYKVIFHKKNQGKGSAIRSGLNEATGSIILIQDADLEYNPEDYAKLIQPILHNEAKVVYGSRERNKENKQHSGLQFYIGGLFLTWLTNFLYGSKLTDEATCYKVFDAKILKEISLKCRRFEFCPEITAKILKQGIKIKEIPISYNPRKKTEGKKIGFLDGLHAIWTLIRYRISG